MKRPSREVFYIRKCPCCGKLFIPAPYHVYKYHNNFVCTWSCLCELNRQEDLKKEKTRERLLDNARKSGSEKFQNAKSLPLESKYGAVLKNVVLGSGNSGIQGILTGTKKAIRIKDINDTINQLVDENFNMLKYIRFVSPFKTGCTPNSILIKGTIKQTTYNTIFEIVPNKIIIESLTPNFVAQMQDKELRDDITIIDKRP